MSYWKGAQWLSGKVLDSRPRGQGFKPHRRLYVVSLSKNNNPSLVLVQPRKTGPFITERLLMGRKKSNQTSKQMCHIGKIRMCNIGCHLAVPIFFYCQQAYRLILDFCVYEKLCITQVMH